jgi:activator of HSP90 ATPase
MEDSKSSGGSSAATHSSSTAKKTSATPKKSTASTPVTNASLNQKEAAATPTLTNAKVIEMFKSGVDEDNIVATIRQASHVQFDVSPDGQIDLAKNGVKGKILAAMRDRTHRTKSSN